jgi:6-phosphogluconolactonase (cycloisomerase 2 family)
MKFTKLGKALLVIALSAGVILGVTSCVESYTVGFLYVTGTVTAQPNGTGNISGFKIDHNTGNLTPINGFPISSGGANPVRATLITGSRFLYVLNRGVNSSGNTDCTAADPCNGANIVQFTVGGNGILTSQEVFFSKGKNPIRLISDTSGSYLMVLDHDAPSSEACELALGKSVTSCGDITVFQINATTGRLSVVLNAQISQPGGEPLPYFPVPADPIDFMLSGGFLITLTGTPAAGDSAFPYAYSSSNGQLTLSQNSVQPLNITEGTAIVNGAGVVYVLDNQEIKVNGAVASQSQILPFTIGNNGALQAEINGIVPDDAAQANPTQLLVESKGKWLYVTNAGDNNTQSGNAESGITGYTIENPYQLVELAGIQPGTGSGPQCIVEDPSDQYIYTANYNDSTVTGKSLNTETGTLQPLVKTNSFSLPGPGTWCVVNGRTD